MKPVPAYPKRVAALTVTSGAMALLCLGLFSIALIGHPEAFNDPVKIIDYPDMDWTLLRGAMLADLAGYYLLLLPVIYYLRPYLHQQTPWAGLITFCGTAYAWGGAIGAAIMGEAASLLYADYYASAPGEQPSIRVAFHTLTYLVYDGLWNLLGSLLGGAWWLLLGYFLKGFGKALGRVTVALGAFTSLDGIGNLLGIEWLAEVGLNAYLVLAPAWALWMGVAIWKKSGKTVSPVQSHLVA